VFRHRGTAFGAASVRIHDVTLALKLGDPGGALASSAGWVPPATLPAERRSHFYIDLAQAQLDTGRPDNALEALHTARAIAPEHVRAHPRVDATAAQLMSSSRRSSTTSFAAWIGTNQLR
jgi:hypothetical protein